MVFITAASYIQVHFLVGVSVWMVVWCVHVRCVWSDQCAPINQHHSPHTTVKIREQIPCTTENFLPYAHNDE